MATKVEKTIGILSGLILGGYLSNNWAKKQEDLNSEDVIWHSIGGILLGALGGYGIASLFGSPNDTVNYTHYHKGKRVYEGITYEDRFPTRMAEHKANGKVFTRVVKDLAKPRVEALELEKVRIKTFRPINNIQHNS